MLLINNVAQITSIGRLQALITTGHAVECIGFSEIASAKLAIFLLSAKRFRSFLAVRANFIAFDVY